MPHSELHVPILLLNDESIILTIPSQSTGEQLYQILIKMLQLLEAEYFDVDYHNKDALTCWLDHNKLVVKQVARNRLKEAHFRFSVRFFLPQPNLLLEEYSRYLFALHIKRELRLGQLVCGENTAALLASYIVQAEVGNYSAKLHGTTTQYLRTLHLIYQPTEQWLKKVMQFHKTHKGMSPTTADYQLLDTVRKVPLYGIRPHPVHDEENLPLNLAVVASGILVLRSLTRINAFSWAKIRKLSFRRRRFLLKLLPGAHKYGHDTVEFDFPTRDECKRFWKECVSYHAFFRGSSADSTAQPKWVASTSLERLRRSVSCTPGKATLADGSGTRVLAHLVAHGGSTFRYRGRTQREVIESVRGTSIRREMESSCPTLNAGITALLPAVSAGALDNDSHPQEHSRATWMPLYSSRSLPQSPFTNRPFGSPCYVVANDRRTLHSHTIEPMNTAVGLSQDFADVGTEAAADLSKEEKDDVHVRSEKSSSIQSPRPRSDEEIVEGNAVAVTTAMTEQTRTTEKTTRMSATPTLVLVDGELMLREEDEHEVAYLVIRRCSAAHLHHHHHLHNQQPRAHSTHYSRKELRRSETATADFHRKEEEVQTKELTREPESITSPIEDSPKKAVLETRFEPPPAPPLTSDLMSSSPRVRRLSHIEKRHSFHCHRCGEMFEEDDQQQPTFSTSVQDSSPTDEDVFNKVSREWKPESVSRLDLSLEPAVLTSAYCPISDSSSSSSTCTSSRRRDATRSSFYSSSWGSYTSLTHPELRHEQDKEEEHVAECSPLPPPSNAALRPEDLFTTICYNQHIIRSTSSPRLQHPPQDWRENCMNGGDSAMKVSFHASPTLMSKSASTSRSSSSSRATRNEHLPDTKFLLEDSYSMNEVEAAEMFEKVSLESVDDMETCEVPPVSVAAVTLCPSADNVVVLNPQVSVELPVLPVKCCPVEIGVQEEEEEEEAKRDLILDEGKNHSRKSRPETLSWRLSNALSSSKETSPPHHLKSSGTHEWLVIFTATTSTMKSPPPTSGQQQQQQLFFQVTSLRKWSHSHESVLCWTSSPSAPDRGNTFIPELQSDTPLVDAHSRSQSSNLVKSSPSGSRPTLVMMENRSLASSHSEQSILSLYMKKDSSIETKEGEEPPVNEEEVVLSRFSPHRSDFYIL